MSKWLESHAYLAEWIAALAVVRSLWQDSVRPAIISTKRAASVVTGYVAGCVIIIYLRFFASKETVKETANWLVLLVIFALVANSLKDAKNQTTEPTWTW
jgi:hypothetical protein